jgi:hypothetical protein
MPQSQYRRASRAFDMSTNNWPVTRSQQGSSSGFTLPIMAASLRRHPISHKGH